MLAAKLVSFSYCTSRFFCEIASTSAERIAAITSSHAARSSLILLQMASETRFEIKSAISMVKSMSGR